MLEAIYMDDFEDIFANNPTKIESVIKHISFRIRRLTYEYVNACKMIYDAAEAELKNSVNDELKKKAQSALPFHKGNQDAAVLSDLDETAFAAIQFLSDLFEIHYSTGFRISYLFT